MLAWLMEQLNDQYELVRILKQNDKSEICLLRHNTLQKDIVRRSFQGNGEVYQVLQCVSQKNIPAVYEVIADENSALVLEEYIDGVTVSEELQRKVFSEKETRRILYSLCEALFALHSIGIIHRDIKPENVIIQNDGIIKLIDYNASKIFKTYKANDTHVIGTTGFAAPEQFGIAQSDERTDIFSLGIMMNVMLTGTHPSVDLYKGKLAKVIDKCTQIDPKKRYHNISCLAEDLL